jgi:hypothetical protein
MAFDGDFYRVTVEEAHALPDREFRALFCETVAELIFECGDMFTREIDFLRDGRRAESLGTSEMREAVLKYQYWFNPKTTRIAANDG